MGRGEQEKKRGKQCYRHAFEADGSDGSPSPLMGEGVRG